MKHGNLFSIIALNICLGLLLCEPAMAYIGPGAGLSAIGAFLAVIAAVIVALFGFVWYPVKRLVQKLRGSQNWQKGGIAQ